MKISQGTISILFGCHSPIHSILVIKAYKKLFGNYPKLWQIVCIFLHDIGHLGLDYLDDYEQKKEHWKLGANTAKKMFGQKGYDFVAGHCHYSGAEPSNLYFADKFSWNLAPYWWLWTNTVFEPKLAMGYSKNEAINKFRNQVRKSVESGEFRSTHDFYLERCKQ